MRAMLLVLGVSVLSLQGCGRADHQAPAPTESLKALPSAQPEPPTPAPQTTNSAPGGTRPSPEPAADECGADKLDAYRNLLPTSEALDKIRAAVGHDRIRIIRPGDVVTLELRPDRLNIEIGEDGRIKLLRCG